MVKVYVGRSSNTSYFLAKSPLYIRKVYNLISFRLRILRAFNNPP